MSAELQALHLQGTKPVEDLEVGDVTDGFSGRVRITHKELRPRKDMLPLVMLTTDAGEWLRFEPGFPVTYYEAERKIVEWPGKHQGQPCPTFAPSDL